MIGAEGDSPDVVTARRHTLVGVIAREVSTSRSLLAAGGGDREDARADADNGAVVEAVTDGGLSREVEVQILHRLLPALSPGMIRAILDRSGPSSVRSRRRR